ncbi:MAG: hypothetical protein QOE85_80 [Actinomycetota bacterium]|nr:hypothetical protein [Actinomycetota bacterium]
MSDHAADPAADTSAGTSPSPAESASPAAWRALVVLLIGMFMALLDTTIVNVALPTIRDNVNGAGSQPAGDDILSWVISGYALAFGIALIPAGRLGDRFGHKWIFFSGLALFTVASLACGLAQSDLQLVIARVVQGLAGGIFLPAVTAFIQILFPGRVRGKAFAIMGAVIGVSSALGPIVGGLIIQAFGTANGWRLVFGVNLPIGVVALVLAIILIPGNERVGEITARTSVRGRSGGVDWIGLVLLTGGLVAILVPLIEGQTVNWKPWTYETLAGGALLIVLFGIWEVFYTRRGRSPLVPPHLFSHPAFTGGTILALVYFAAFTSIFFTISLLWQAGLGHTALESGLVSVPFAIGSIIGSSQSNRLAQRLGRTVLIIGTGLVAASLLVIWIILLNVDGRDLTNWDLLAPLFFAGLGNGMFIAPNAQFIVATVDPSEAGAASGVIATMQRVGAAIGIAVIGSVLFTLVANVAPSIHSQADLGTAFTNASAGAIGVSVIFAVVAFALVFALPRRLSQQRPAH